MQNLPSQRLTTYNLVNSAFEINRKSVVSWETIQNLSVLIDIFCLYDHAVVLGGQGSQDNVVLEFEKRHAESGMSVPGEQFFLVEQLAQNSDSVRRATKQHLALFLGAGSASGIHQHIGDYVFDELFDTTLRMSGIRREPYEPDSTDQIEFGREWLLTVPERKDISNELLREQEAAKGVSYLMRTFMYLAYADSNRLVLTADATRMPVLDQVAQVEEQFRGKLIQHLRAKWQENPVTLGSALWSRISPLSSIVYERAAPRRERIWKEMIELRAELAPVRQRLRAIEDQSLYATSLKDAEDAIRALNGIIEEIDRSFQGDHNLIHTSVKPFLSFGKSIAGPGDLHHPKAWLEALIQSPVAVLSRIINRRGAIEIHRLRSQMPPNGRLSSAVSRLFGDTIL